MENVLIIKHGALGDFVICMGIMRALREAHPEARFTLLTSSPYVKLGEKMGMFSEVIVDNREPWWKIQKSVSVMRSIFRGRFDHVYDLQGSSRTLSYRRLWRLFAPAGSSCFWVRASDNAMKLHRACVPLLPGRAEEVAYDLPERVTDLSFLHGSEKHFHLLPERFVMLIPGCSPQHLHKRWPVENYREIVRRCAELGISSVIIGTKAEAAEANAIAEGNPYVVNMIGLTEIFDVPQIALRALAVVGNDTGPSHMASLTGAFTIAIYDYRHAGGALRGPRSVNLLSTGLISLITPDEVWKHLAPQLSAEP